MTETAKLRISAFVTSLCAALLLVLALATDGSQGLFQLFMPPADYAALLMERASILRLDIGVDLLFIAAYLSFFVLWAQHIAAAGANRTLAAIALGLIMVTALLDAIENAHILAMLRAVELGVLPSQGELLGQQVASQVKFQAVYCGMAVLGLLWRPRKGRIWLSVLFIAQLVAGLAIFVAFGTALKLLYLFRASLFVVGPLLVAALMETRPDQIMSQLPPPLLSQ
jgi:hypothetical protein